jgi:hypothetical protein
VHGFASCRYVRGIAVGEATDFIGSGLDPGVGVGVHLFFVFDGDPGCWIDGAGRKKFDG